MFLGSTDFNGTWNLDCMKQLGMDARRRKCLKYSRMNMTILVIYAFDIRSNENLFQLIDLISIFKGFFSISHLKKREGDAKARKTISEHKLGIVVRG